MDRIRLPGVHILYANHFMVLAMRWQTTTATIFDFNQIPTRFFGPVTGAEYSRKTTVVIPVIFLFHQRQGFL